MFGMEEAPVPVKKSLEYLVATVSISSGISALGNAWLMGLICRLTVPLETRLLAIFHRSRAGTGTGSRVSSSKSPRIGGTELDLFYHGEEFLEAVMDDRG